MVQQNALEQPIKRSLFTPNIHVKPYEYPELIAFMEAIRHSYWIHTEFNFLPDIQDYKVNITEEEKQVITRSMLAISQIEVNVKRFWGDLYHYFPKVEIDAVGATFAESEVRHFDAYSSLLEKLGLNELFENLKSYKPLMARVAYLSDFMKKKNDDKKGFILSLIMFSLFVEHISLFGQFYTISSFNKEKNLFKGINNVILATSKEEEVHGNFGIELYRILRVENPELFTQEFFDELLSLSESAYKAEMDIIDWIYEGVELDWLPKDLIKGYVSQRYNKSLVNLGLDPKYQVDKQILNKTMWFDLEIVTTSDNDNFNKRNTNYAKKNIKTETDENKDDLFGDLDGANGNEPSNPVKNNDNDDDGLF